MSNKKLAYLAVATMIGAALIAAPAQARGGGGGVFGGGGVHTGAAGGFGGGGMRPAGIGPGFAGHRFVGPLFGVGVGLYGASSCWTVVPTAFGWEQVWTC